MSFNVGAWSGLGVVLMALVRKSVGLRVLIGYGQSIFTNATTAPESGSSIDSNSVVVNSAVMVILILLFCFL